MRDIEYMMTRFSKERGFWKESISLYSDLHYQRRYTLPLQELTPGFETQSSALNCDEDVPLFPSQTDPDTPVVAGVSKHQFKLTQSVTHPDTRHASSQEILPSSYDFVGKDNFFCFSPSPQTAVKTYEELRYQGHNKGVFKSGICFVF